MNILASPLPRTVPVGGASVPIKSGYRVGIQVARAVDADLSDAMIAGTVLRLYFGDRVPDDAAAALEAAMMFHRCGDLPPDERASRRKPKRLLDWDRDAPTILADFRREYGIDLANETTRMHWWVFMAYFNNLSSGSEIKTAMYYRNTSCPKDVKGADRKRFQDLRKYYALPAKTTEEAAAREAAKWGDME